MECPKCTQPAPAQEDDMLAGSLLDPVFLASVVSAKMKSGLPLYRQEASFGESRISRRLLSANMMRAGERIAYNLIPLLEDELNKAALINCDETTINIVKLKGADGKKKGANSKANAFMVVRVGTYGDGRPGPVVFTYTDNRRNQTIADFIGHYTGCVQTDGLKAYSNAASKGDFVHLECLVHARRKAIEAAEGFKSGKAVDLVRMYANIFHQEGILNDKYPVRDDAFVEERRRGLLPLFQELQKECWSILRGSVTPSKDLKTACNYYLERYDTLIRFLDYPFATSSNQLAEQQIRPFVVGRKGFLFCVTELGAEVSASYYSLVQTCVRMGIDVEDYLTHVFFNGGRLKDGDAELWSKLLPGKADLTEAHNYRMMLRDAQPDVNRSEPYVLRGRKPV